ncbi:MAG: ArsB/NhaD family transporter [Acidimicrobiia bacterium]
MARVGDQWSSLWPALAFLLAGVPLASLLDRVGFFTAAATVVLGRGHHDRSVAGLWVLAAVTTAVLNLDTTVVLLTPLYLRIAREADVDPVPLVAVPLLLAGFASSALPISNLTTLIAAERFDLGALDVLTHLALPSLAAVVVGWSVYRRRHPTVIGVDVTEPPDRRALALGGTVVAGLLVGFVIGPIIGVDAWVVALAADVLLVVMTRTVPWREVPVTTALLVGAIATAVALVVPEDALRSPLHHSGPGAVGVLALGGGALANAVNNLPALLVGADAVHHMTWGMWGWLLGVNVGAVLLPIGALANLLWLRIVRAEGLTVPLRRYVAITLPIGLPAAAAAVAVLVAERALWP